MCGIAGILGHNAPQTVEQVKRMVQAVAHRGPNARRTMCFPGAVLGHARLSILDLEDRALQPMSSDDGRHVLVFNGEIYNFKELRDELTRSHVFRTTSDTEVLLAAFRAWGKVCLERLNGMFAFCLYDTEQRTAFLARDRFGQKPLFFTTTSNELWFASEIKGLLAAGLTARPDQQSWSRYLAHAQYDDTDATFFADVKQLRPGEWAVWQPGASLKREHYYRIADRITPRRPTVEEAAAEVRALMVDATTIHMRSDVPVGISLSGGLDSSALLSCLSLGNGIPTDLACFSMEYGEDLTERPWIDAAAGRFGLTSHYGRFTRQKFLASLPAAMWHQEAPIGGLPNCALDEVARMACARRVPVIQDGTGLDEAFAGYRNHHNLYLGRLLVHRDPNADKALRQYAANWQVDVDIAQAAALGELQRSGTAIDGTLPTRSDLLSKRTLEIAGEPDVFSNEEDPLIGSLMDYLQTRKIPRNMRMKDRATMAYGIELRLPFLDHRLVEYALSLPPSHFFLHGRTKSIVREAMLGAMDDSVRTAAKRSIQAPQEPWLRTAPMAGFIEDILDDDRFAARGYIDRDKARSAYAEFRVKGAANSFFVWQWINLEVWHRVFIDSDAVSNPIPACPEVSGYSAAIRAAG